MDVEAYDVGDGLQLERAGLDAFGEEVGELHLNAVPGVGPEDQRLRLNFAPFYLGKVVVQRPLFFNVLPEDEEAALGVVPAVVVVDHVCLHRRDVKALYVFRSAAGAGVRVQGPGHGIFHGVGFFKNGGLPCGLPARRQDAQRRLEGLFSERPLDEVGVAGMQVIPGRRQGAVPQGHQGFNGRAVGVTVLCGYLHLRFQTLEDLLHIVGLTGQRFGLGDGLDVHPNLVFARHIQQIIETAIPLKIFGGDLGGVIRQG